MMKTRVQQAVRPVILLLVIQIVWVTGFADVCAAQSRGDSDRSVPVSSVSDSFEDAKAGPFPKLDTAVGKWVAGVGLTIIDDRHAKTGRKCLQLTGGEKTVVILQLADDVDTSGTLSFWAERWTVREPFSFRIEKRSGDEWLEIYNGDAQVRVGRAFLNQVVIPLADGDIRQLRFTCTSPPDTGILIDDIRIAPAVPQEIVSVVAEPFTLPALVGAKASPLLKLRITTAGQLEPISLGRLQARIHGAGAIDSLRFTRDGGEGGFELALPADFQTAGNWMLPSLELSEGENTFWISCRLKDDADIDERVGMRLERVTFSNGRTIAVDTPPTLQRLGVAVRDEGDDDVHTYRIPGLATTNNGTLIGVYDVRRQNGGDLPGDIDIGMSRSTDGGRTWEPMRVIMDMGDDPRWRYDGIGDPAVLTDRDTGTIWVAGTWSHGNRSWHGSGPGLTPDETGQLMLARSDDDGVTWSRPINITSQVKRPEWCFILQGPGKGITMRDGTIVFAAQYQDPPENHRLPHSTIIYSRDHGETWQVGTGAFDDTTEAQVIEVEPGVLMLNCRYNRGSARVVMVTRDMGKTWERHPTSERSLIEPGACMASLIDVDREVGSDVGNWLLFSNPDSLSGRNHMTIKASPDRGLTWPRQHRLLLDEGNSAGYSCMSMIDDQTIGILYEGSQAHMTFQRIKLSDVLGTTEQNEGETSDAGNGIPLGAGASPAARRLWMPRVFGNHMVMQADAPLPVWGTALPSGEVVVTLGDEMVSTTADNSGAWQVRFPPRGATSVPTTLVVRSGEERLVFDDVLVGEVWICAGQSNMEWRLNQSTNGARELAELSAHSAANIRLLDLTDAPRGSAGGYTAEELARLTPETFAEGRWGVASPAAAAEFSAVGWYFGRHLQEQLNVPVGLICPAVGGSPTEAWIPREALARDDELKGLVAGHWLDNGLLGEFCPLRGEQNLLRGMQAGELIPSDDLGPNHPFKPGFLWSAGIQPLIPFAIRGVIWYQGESNAESPARVRQHERLFPLLVGEWRRQWRQGDFPFLFVQLPALNRPDWPQFRDGQRRLLDRLDNTGMAITIDTGDPTDVHPHEKQPVGERLALWALGTTYRSPAHAVYSGPLVEVAERHDGALVVSFHHAGSGLKTRDGQPPRHFEVCGEDGEFHPATARILDDMKSLAVSSPQVPEPTHVRYAWQPYPDPPVNLVNSSELPASPFSTRPQR
ncbi:MAG: exo-alpha-sialidase [Planctomycetaceae bacterium]